MPLRLGHHPAILTSSPLQNLDDPLVFTPPNLTAIRQALDAQNPLYSFSPLRSFRRIICAFYTADHAVEVRQKLDGETVLGQRIRVYFGQETKIATSDEDLHLKAPQSQKLFFISPPPSPPHGWESKNEDPPNKEVHADDLADALHKLNARADFVAAEKAHEAEVKRREINRNRSDSRTIVYHPVEQGHSPDLPAIAVEDTSESPSPITPSFEQQMSMMDVDCGKKDFIHTARPPVELME